ncbi:MAG TPA: cytochrome c [Steroidobacteraceae bacterium]|jgi:mono/diheme cytochrome c family protein|nr:cytochrome c [Steroidobacteraceae bacterium]
MNATPPKRPHPILWVLAAIVLIAIGVAGYYALSPHPTDFAGGKRVALAAYTQANPSGVPAELKDASLAARGEYLTRAADCAACHTARDGTPFAGGRAFVLPFGTIYSTNITPDADTGIGNYSDENFLDAVHKGIGRGGARLYPAMPYASYTYMTDADALAIKAYLFALKPVHAPTPANTFKFPFSRRGLMKLWSAFFNPDKRFRPNAARSPEWNRGAYLAEAMAHCGECHTPRNLAFALDNRRKFAGAVQAGWRAYNVTPDRASGVGAWSDADLANYLSEGHAAGHGTASGPMGEAVDESLSHLTPSDIAALVAYLRSVPGISTADLPAARLDPAPMLSADATAESRGKGVYEGACAGCHGWSGVSPVIPFATLTGTRAINDATGNNVAQVIIGGGERHYPRDSDNMPPFGSTYSDAEIASVSNYVTARFGSKGSNLTAAEVAKLRSQN